MIYWHCFWGPACNFVSIWHLKVLIMLLLYWINCPNVNFDSNRAWCFFRHINAERLIASLILAFYFKKMLWAKHTAACYDRRNTNIMTALRSEFERHFRGNGIEKTNLWFQSICIAETLWPACTKERRWEGVNIITWNASRCDRFLESAIPYATLSDWCWTKCYENNTALGRRMKNPFTDTHRHTHARTHTDRHWDMQKVPLSSYKFLCTRHVQVGR